MSAKGKKRLKTRPTVPSEKKVEAGPAIVLTPGFWKRNYMAALVIFALPFILYAATFQFGYVLDDKIVISENSYVKEGISGIGKILSEDTFMGYFGEQKNLVAGGRYRPLSLVYFAVVYDIIGDKPGIFHLLNVLWYGGLGLLLLRILDILFPSGNRKWYLSVPFAAALLYIAHPVHSEAVANIKGLDEIMTSVLAFLSMYLSLLYLHKPKPILLAISGLVFLLALLAKENALTFLAAIPLTIYVFTNAGWKENLKTWIPLFAATIVYLIIRYQVMGYLLDHGQEITGLMNDPFRDMNNGQKYATISYTLWRYIQLLFFPHPLTHDYYPYHIPITEWTQLRAILPLVLHVALVGYAIFGLRKRGNVASWAILFYLITLSITSNIVFTIGTFMNERFIFIPSLGFTVWAAYLLLEQLGRRFSHTKNFRLVALSVILLITAGYSYKTITRVPAWKDSFSLNSSAVKVSKNSARINNFMGYEYYIMANNATDPQEKRKYLNESTKYVDHALSIHDDYPDALNVKAGLVAAYYQMDGDLQTLLDNFHDLHAIRYVPFIDTYMEYLNRRGAKPELTAFYHRTGYELFGVKQRNYVLAEKYINYGLGLEPNQPLLNLDLARIRFAQGRYRECFDLAMKALNLDPTLDEARRVAGLAQEKL